MLDVVLSGVLLGLSLAAPPGPVNAVIAIEGARRPIRGTLVGLGAMTSDAIFLIAVLYLGSLIPSWFRRPMFLLGGIVMLYFAISVLRMRRAEKEEKVGHGPYLKGLAIGMTNPYQIGWWATAGLSSISLFGPMFALGFFLGIGIWIIVFPLVIRKGVSLGGDRILLLIRAFSFIVLVAFSVYFMVNFVVSK
jgi:threonine/homoserine/homoserine lactone efflux protein